MKIQFHHLKSSAFRVVHCDGMLLSPGPHGSSLQVTVYSERIPIPQITVHNVDPVNGTIEAQDIVGERIAREGVVRELECTFILGLENAEALIKQLEVAVSTVKMLDKARGAVGEKE